MNNRRFLFWTLTPGFAVLAILALISIAGALYFSVMDRSLRYPDYHFAVSITISASCPTAAS